MTHATTLKDHHDCLNCRSIAPFGRQAWCFMIRSQKWPKGHQIIYQSIGPSLGLGFAARAARSGSMGGRAGSPPNSSVSAGAKCEGESIG
jgi:hypothetical protein